MTMPNPTPISDAELDALIAKFAQYKGADQSPNEALIFDALRLLKAARAEIERLRARSLATATEIGRGIGREEAAKVCDAMAEKMNAQYTNLIAEGHVDRITPVIKEYAATALATAIRALSPAVDMDELVERCAYAADYILCNAMAKQEPHVNEAIARIVLSELGLEMVKE